MKCEKLKFRLKRRKFIREASNMNMNGIDHLEIFSRPKPIENSRPCLVFQTDIFLQKTVVGFPCLLTTD